MTPGYTFKALHWTIDGSISDKCASLSITAVNGASLEFVGGTPVESETDTIFCLGDVCSSDPKFIQDIFSTPFEHVLEWKDFRISIIVSNPAGCLIKIATARNKSLRSDFDISGSTATSTSIAA